MKKNLFLVAGLAMIFASCRFSDCDDPHVTLSFTLDSTEKLVYRIETYKKGSKFSTQLSSKLDSAYVDKYPDAKYERGRFIKLDDKYDHQVSIPSSP